MGKAIKDHVENNVVNWVKIDHPAEWSLPPEYVTFDMLVENLEKGSNGLYIDRIMELETMPRENIMAEALFRWLAVHNGKITKNEKCHLMQIYTPYGIEEVLSQYKAEHRRKKKAEAIEA